MKRSSFLLLAPLQIAQALVGFGAIAAFTRMMDAEAFGRYALALSASMLAHTLVFTWAEAAAFRHLSTARAEGRLQQHFATLLTIAVGLGGAVLAVALVLLALCGVGDNAGAIAAFAAASAVFRFITKLSRETDRAELRLQRYALRESAYLLIGFAAGVALLQTTSLGAAAPLVGALTAGVVIFLFDAPQLLARRERQAADVRRVFLYAQYGAPLALALALDLGAQTLARFIVAHQSGAAALGAYAAAFGLSRPLDLIFLGISGAFTPVIYAAYAETGAEAARNAANRGFKAMSAIVLPAAIGLALVAMPLSALMVGPALRAETAQALPWMALAAAFGGFNVYYFSEAFQLAQKTGLRAWLMLSSASVQIVCTLLLPHTAAGAALAAALGAMTGTVLLVVAGRRLVRLPVDWRHLTQLIAAVAIMALAVRLTPMTADVWGLAIGVTVGVATYAASAVALNIFGLHEKASTVWQAVGAYLSARLHDSLSDRRHVQRPS